MSSSSAAGSAGLSACKVLRRAPVPRHAARSAQLPPLPAAALSGRDGDAVARRHRLADPLDPPARPNVRVLLGDATRVDVAARQSHAHRRATLDCLRLSDRRHRREPHLLRARRVGAYAPGLKTLEDALEIRPRVLLAFERAERETRSGAAARAADVRPGRRRPHRRRAGRHAGGDRSPDAAGRIPLHRHRPRASSSSKPARRFCRRFPELRDAARASLERLGIEVRESARVTGDRRARGVDARRGAALARAPSSGRPAWPRRRSCGRLACRSTARGACSSSPTSRFPAIRRCSSWATPLPSASGRAAAARRGAGRDAGSGARGRGIIAAASQAGRPSVPFVYHDLGQHGDRRPRLGDCRPRVDPLLRASHGWRGCFCTSSCCRLPQPPRRDAGVGGGVRDVSAQRRD